MHPLDKALAIFAVLVIAGSMAMALRAFLEQ